ncbi:tetratricopeptide repeat protein [Massilia sp. METH4]|uniref:O-linked N-acetylglucosamine transferase family protein n=1 Tax=Massilia sp. METH4 TaxID=3123041 RepID=UPI0030D0F9A2
MTTSETQLDDPTLSAAIAHHQAGRLDEAESAYREVLARRPYHPLANHNLGMLMWQQERAAEGLPYLRQAWSVNPDEGQFWLSYAEGLLRAGKPAEARDLLAGAQARGLDGPQLHALQARVASELATRPAPEDTQAVAQLFGAGDYAGAEAAVRALIGRYPTSGMLWGMLGTILQVQGKEALAVLEEAARLSPDDAENLVGLGNAQQGAQQYVAAIATYRRALALAPDLPEAWCNLGSAQVASDDLEAAVDSFRQACRLRHDYLLAYLNLGSCEAALERLEDAAKTYRHALALAPDDLDIASTLANVLGALGRHAEAADLYRSVLDKASHDPVAWLRHGHGQRNLENMDEAAEAYRRAEALCGDHVDLLVEIGVGLQFVGAPDDAKRVYQRLLELDPNQAIIQGNLGVIYEGEKDYDQACVHYRAAIAADPTFVDAHQNLGTCLTHMLRPAEALEQFRRVLELQPGHKGAMLSMSAVLAEQGLLAEAIANSRAALEILPGNLELTGNLLFCLSHSDNVSAEELAAEHFRFGSHAEGIAWEEHPNDRNPDRVIRLGFVSGDFNNHALHNFFSPILERLRHSDRVRLYAYYNNELEDPVTEELRPFFSTWHCVPKMSDEALAALIRKDGIDVLIDLSGHTNRNRLGVFARKPAPVQATWIGYPGTTGLKAMDYILHDRHTLLPEMAPQFTERFAYLPSCAVFRPRNDLPPVNPLPAATNGYITYGSFNRINKLRRPVIALWSKLLRAQPTSRLMLAGLPTDGNYGHLPEWFTEEGIDLARIDFQPRVSLYEYAFLHHKVDLCLDTFPYTGGTTTLQSLWMGIPLLTLAGPTLAGRSSAGVLEQLNLHAFVADSEDTFVERGLAVTARLDLLADLRQHMRALLSLAPMSRPDVVATALEGAVRHMWHRWCAGEQPETFEIEYEITPATNAEVHAAELARAL